ncbi:MAG: hypothetical protein GOV15_01365 [Candidatus Diapherotrites archaeon]|nr:hypothetical protein [Candidatus Diapherotrites archaeon]
MAKKPLTKKEIEDEIWRRINEEMQTWIDPDGKQIDLHNNLEDMPPLEREREKQPGLKGTIPWFDNKKKKDIGKYRKDHSQGMKDMAGRLEDAFQERQNLYDKYKRELEAQRDAELQKNTEKLVEERRNAKPRRGSKIKPETKPGLPKRKPPTGQHERK